jgi:hypothetical protein
LGFGSAAGPKEKSAQGAMNEPREALNDAVDAMREKA